VTANDEYARIWTERVTVQFLVIGSHYPTKRKVNKENVVSGGNSVLYGYSLEEWLSNVLPSSALGSHILDENVTSFVHSN
jgi:hypothetical protein